MQYSEIEAALFDLAQRVTDGKKRIEQAKQTLLAAKVSLTEGPNAHAAALAQIEANLATAPDDPLEPVQKARKDAVLADLEDVLADIDQRLSALDGVS